MIYLLFYIVTRLDTVLVFSKLLFAISACGGAIISCLYYMSLVTRDEDGVLIKPAKDYLIKIATISLALAVLIPTSKQAAFIVIGPQIVQNGAVKDTVKNIPELTKLGTQYLKELLQEHVKGNNNG